MRPPPSSFRNVLLRAEHIRQLDNRMRWLGECLLAILILASLRTIKVKMRTVFCVLRVIRLHQMSGIVDGYPLGLLMC